MMKILKSLIPLLGLLFLLWLAFVDNIPIRQGDEYNCISPEEFFEAQPHPYQNAQEDDALIEFADYLDFVSKLDELNQHFKRESFMDTTGDGNQERVLNQVTLSEHSCHIKNSIHDGETELWSEEIFLNEKDLEVYFGKHRLPEINKKQALAYLAHNFSRFTATRDEFLTSGALEALKRNALSSNNTELNASIESLHSYRGQFVFKRNPAESAVFIWNSETLNFDRLIAFNAEA